METVADKRAKCENFYTQKLGLSVVERGLKVSLPIKEGVKDFEGLKFDNGRIAVFCRGDSVLRYAWA